MNIPGIFQTSDIHQDVQACRSIPGAMLLDVRTPEEFTEGHIPGSINIPLQVLPMKQGLPEDPDTPIFVYCRSGGRSRRAAAFLEKVGYTNVKNIGGLLSWKGELEK